MLTIRLQRSGKRNQPEFRIILAEKTAAAGKKFVEILGRYNPRNKAFSMDRERLTYWMSQRVELSPTIHNLLVTHKLLDASKVKAFNIPKKPAVAEESAPADSPAAQAPVASSEPAADTAPAETPAPETPAPAESSPAAEAPVAE